MIPPSVHDNNVYAYSVLCEERRIVLHTESYPYGNPRQHTDVHFTGVLAHYFADELQGNILSDVTEVDPEWVTAEWAGVFAERKNYGWPDGIEYREPDELPALLRQRNFRAYRVSSSYGLQGWVLAEAVEFRPRPDRHST